MLDFVSYVIILKLFKVVYGHLVAVLQLSQLKPVMYKVSKLLKCQFFDAGSRRIWCYMATKHLPLIRLGSFSLSCLVHFDIKLVL